MKHFITCVAFLTLTACGGGSSPSAPSTASVSGTWTGTLTSNQVAGASPARFTLTQTGTAISGTWTTDGNGGSLSGTISGSSLTVRADPSDPRTCPFNATVTVAGAAMTGTYAAFNCTVAVSGGIALVRQ